MNHRYALGCKLARFKVRPTGGSLNRDPRRHCARRVRDERTSGWDGLPFHQISASSQVGIILLIDYNTAHEVGKPLKGNVALKGS